MMVISHIPYGWHHILLPTVLPLLLSGSHFHRRKGGIRVGDRKAVQCNGQVKYATVCSGDSHDARRGYGA